MTLIARLERMGFPDGSLFDIDMFTGAGDVSDADVFATLVLITCEYPGTREKSCVTVFSPRRDEWSIPGGWREAGESPLECAVREVTEETNLILDPATLAACGYEIYTPIRVHGRWPTEGGVLQLFHVKLQERPPLEAILEDAVDPKWMSIPQFRELAGERFWWPMIEAVLDAPSKAP